MRSDANKIAFRAIRGVLGAARPLTLTLVNSGTEISCAPSPGPSPVWQSKATNLQPEADGIWPVPVHVQCTWPGGKCTLVLSCAASDAPRYSGQLALVMHVGAQQLVYCNVANDIGDSADGEIVTVDASVSSSRQKDTEGVRAVLNETLKKLVQDSGLPKVTDSRVEAFKLEVPTGVVSPSPEQAFRRILQLALLKLDFFDRAQAAQTRGTPLVDVAAILSAAGAPVGKAESLDEGDEEPKLARNYWAGGFLWGSGSMLKPFLDQRFWQVGWPRTSTKPAARQTWERFDRIRAGDWFAIKGYGGTHDLVIHLVGEVKSIDPNAGRVELTPVQVPLFKNKAPRGTGAGNWFDTLVPVTRPDIIEQLFSQQSEDAEKAPPIDLPPNLILYGPPGTGKTYRLRQDLMPMFERHADGAAPAVAAESVAELTWFEVVTVVLHQLGGRAKAQAIYEHPLVKAKHAAQGIPTLARQVVWGCLQQHTVESSKTVHYQNRTGELIFDKTEDALWHFAAPIPDELAELIKEFAPNKPQGGKADHVFVTFHQAYAYEDFIEGIRPHLGDGELSGPDAGLRYVLEHGVFKRAVLDAIRVAGFEGTIDEFCRLPAQERRQQLEGKRPYAVFIDEINRGNVARVFGELITLLEADKRLGAENELIVRLPYSRTLFGVPSNLHVIGTMNTADRSVEALDTALRRRFAFEELPPRPELLDFMIDAQIDPKEMLRAINRRLEKLYDRDHAIGHAFFLPLGDEPTLDALKQVFERQVLPLLQEYFFGDWGKIGLVLGPEFVRKRDAGLARLAEFYHDDREALEERVTYELTPVKDLTSLSFRRIYEHVAEDA